MSRGLSAKLSGVCVRGEGVGHTEVAAAYQSMREITVRMLEMCVSPDPRE